MTPTLLRHSHITWALAQNLTNNEKSDLANKMAHSVAVQSTYNVIQHEDDSDDALDLANNAKVEELLKKKIAKSKQEVSQRLTRSQTKAGVK